MSAPATWHVDVDGEICTAVVEGEIDQSNASRIGHDFVEGTPNHVAGMLLDLTAVTFLDSAGIRMIFALSDRLHQRRQRCVVVVPAESSIRRVLAITSMEATVPIVGSVDEARGSLLADEN